MCNPIAILMGAQLAIQTGSAIAGASARNAAAKANAEAARKAQKESVRDLNRIEVQVGQRASAQITQGERIGQQVRGSIRASASEAGVSGRSVDDLVDEVARNVSEARIATQRQAELDVEGLDREKITGLTIERQRIASVPRANPFATALQIGGAATDAYLNFRTLTTE